MGRALEELLGIRDRAWGAAEAEDRQLMKAVEDSDCLTFRRYNCDPDYEDGFEFIADMVITELSLMFLKKYWSPLWVIQELAVSPTTSTVPWRRVQKLKVPKTPWSGNCGLWRNVQYTQYIMTRFTGCLGCFHQPCRAR